MKKAQVLVAVLLAFALLAFAAPTVARADGTPPPVAPGLMDPGADRYYTILGIADIPTNAQNGSGAASGAFGYFGKDLNMAGGANGYQTGLNNSGVAGNRQGNLP